MTMNAEDYLTKVSEDVYIIKKGATIHYQGRPVELSDDIRVYGDLSHLPVLGFHGDWPEEEKEAFLQHINRR